MSASVHPLSARQSAFVMAIVSAVALGSQVGCVATKYKLAKKSAPPVQLLNIAFPPSPVLQPTLATLISYRGPGSWKREALWDEYVVTLENHADRALTIDSAALADAAGMPYAAGADPWVLEKQSKKLEKQYRDRGEAFMRAAGPGVLIVGVGAATASAAASTVFISAGVAGAAVAAVFVLPVYYVSVLGINHHNKKAVMTEFNRRRLPLPLTLSPGEPRTGSLFFPMVRSPSSLTLGWSNDGGSAQAVLPLDFLQALHVPAAPVGHASNPVSP
jgi:hypothetical protein